MISKNSKAKAMFHVLDMQVKQHAWLRDQIAILLMLVQELKQDDEAYRRFKAVLGKLAEVNDLAFKKISEFIKAC